MFSSRLPGALHTNDVTRAYDRLRAAGTAIIDLTETNPTSVGLSYPANLHAALASPDALSYTPESLGMPSARAVVAAEFARQGAIVQPEHVVLTASTSEAYSLLFKLLCDAGDEVLIPQPSYPLFELLSRLDLVKTVPYHLHMHGGWALDRASIEQAWSPRTRAVLVVSPNNPTGSVLSDDDAVWLSEWCGARGLAIIADEVFLDYPLRARSLPHSFIGTNARAALAFSLGGLSKSAGLPQMKLGWMAVSGPEALVAESVAKLELICDTYLSVATPVQVAARELIAAGGAIREAIQTRVRTNLEACRAIVATRPDMSVLEPEAGWCVVLQVPATESEERLVLRLLESQHVLVHPGYFFDFAKEAFLVLSLLPDPRQFAEGLSRIVRA